MLEPISPFGSLIRGDLLLSRIARIFPVGRIAYVNFFQSFFLSERSLPFQMWHGSALGISDNNTRLAEVLFSAFSFFQKGSGGVRRP